MAHNYRVQCDSLHTCIQCVRIKWAISIICHLQHLFLSAGNIQNLSWSHSETHNNPLLTMVTLLCYIECQDLFLLYKNIFKFFCISRTKFESTALLSAVTLWGQKTQPKKYSSTTHREKSLWLWEERKLGGPGPHRPAWRRSWGGKV